MYTTQNFIDYINDAVANNTPNEEMIEVLYHALATTMNDIKLFELQMQSGGNKGYKSGYRGVYMSDKFYGLHNHTLIVEGVWGDLCLIDLDVVDNIEEWKHKQVLKLKSELLKEQEDIKKRIEYLNERFLEFF